MINKLPDISDAVADAIEYFADILQSHDPQMDSCPVEDYAIQLMDVWLLIQKNKARDKFRRRLWASQTPSAS